jgi:hypothetical protein
MRHFLTSTIAVILFFAASASAQDRGPQGASVGLGVEEWTEYNNKVDRFTINAPGQPTAEDIKWPSEYGAVMPGRVYRWTSGASKYSVTVIDYTDAERIHSERTNHTEADSNNMYWRIDIQASIQYAATKLYRQRPGAKVTFDAWHYIDLVSGQQLQLTNEDQSRTFVGIYLHENRLYITEATVPPRAPQPGLFQQSVGFLDENGNHVRYREIYFNRTPAPKLQEGRGGRGGAGRGGGQGQGGGAPQQ